MTRANLMRWDWIGAGILGALLFSSLTMTPAQRPAAQAGFTRVFNTDAAMPMNSSPLLQIPASSSFQAGKWPREGVPDFVFVARSHGGALAGQGIEEFDWTLQADARAGAVAVESFRSDGDIPGHPLGIFRFRVEDSHLRAFYQLVTEARINQLVPAMKEHPAYTETRYYLKTGGDLLADKTINNGDHESMARIRLVNAQITRWLSQAFQHPERAARLSLRHAPAPGQDRWEVSIANVGVEPVVFADPRWISPERPLHQAAVLVTEFPAAGPNDPPVPLRWRETPLDPLPNRPSSEPVITLGPGEVFQVAAAWDRPAKRRFLAYALWSNYRGDPMKEGVYRIRGRTQSNRVTVEP